MQIYVALTDTGLRTIGYTDDPEKVKGLETSVPMNPSLVESVLANVRVRLEPYRQEDTDWYACDLEVIRSAIDAAHAQEHEDAAAWQKEEDKRIAEKYVGVGHVASLERWLRD